MLIGGEKMQLRSVVFSTRTVLLFCNEQ